MLDKKAESSKKKQKDHVCQIKQYEADIKVNLAEKSEN